MKEKELYKPVAFWLEQYLYGKFRNVEIQAFDSHEYYVSDVIAKKNLSAYFPQFSTYKVKIDVLGVVLYEKTGFLALIECKIKPITIMDLSQVIGYSKILNPILSVIISPQKWSNSIHCLIEIFKRQDVLEYAHGRKIVLSKWDINSNSVSYSETLPIGYLANFKTLI
ncbi:MAG TPA: hypothetical protein EYP60_03960 [bacterium (Candidatus Stahlbacteria)]|nr:hypothetical protein [Candidatus Stahlbacteria bacterium]